MMTYDETEKVLFSGDAFGCFGTLDGGVLDTEINLDKYWDEMYRYYANIRENTAHRYKSLAKLAPLEIRYICTTHGRFGTKIFQKLWVFMTG